ncbi:MAG: glycosyltransferase family 2 protein [Thioclava marina]|uniref:glycosyltransferase family 2 protein n=1 Tax=Thioclava marina TaxID=1915077 RepID=UPI001998900E|nr:glycosyltransferase family 2 protein [Thioclava marina]MBC7144515.1 glycosyltransferase family 2 protein [Thioclava marina]
MTQWKDRERKLRVTVAALTRGRPKMLRDLLKSWGQMALPSNCHVKALVVENDSESFAADVIQTMTPLQNGLVVDHILEAHIGIPFGRNCAARVAIASGSDLLVFVDDDEVVLEDWLIKFVDGYRNSVAVLLGGPVRAAAPNENLSGLQEIFYESLERIYEKRERRKVERCTLNDCSDQAIGTGNWLAETRLFSEYGIWFDPSLRYTGGEDTRFCSDLAIRGLKTGWVADAIAYETIPAARLTFRYQYRRARDHTNFDTRGRGAISTKDKLKITLKLIPRTLGAFGLLVSVPFTKGRTLLKLAHSAGLIAGRLRSMSRKESKHYEKTTGY